MKKIKKFMNDPITWGAYLKLAGACTVLGTVLAAVSLIYVYKDEIREKFIDSKRSKNKVSYEEESY